jgi:hypothetical protein
MPAARIKRGPPSKAYYKTTVRDALPDLLRDFAGRCAYSMVHYQHLGGFGPLNVEHFDPRQKQERIQNYDNLFPVSSPCNCAKGSKWPNEEEANRGLRFLNCCEELDYGGQIFEDPRTHELVGTTTAARFHLRYCGLKGGVAGEFLKDRRKERTKIWATLANYGITPENAEQSTHADEFVAMMVSIALKLIPPIPAPMSAVTVS